MADHITHDPIYNTVDRDDFTTMIEVDRYARPQRRVRRDHRADARPLLGPERPGLHRLRRDAVRRDRRDHHAARLHRRAAVRRRRQARRGPEDPARQREHALDAVVDPARRAGRALALGEPRATILRDPGAQEYAANQAREEARHVTGFARYIEGALGHAAPVRRRRSANLLNEIVLAPEVYKKIVGMQMLVEGLAMGAFATLHSRHERPAAAPLVQLVMTDEAFHHKFGKIWADRTMPKLTEEEHDQGRGLGRASASRRCSSTW